MPDIGTERKRKVLEPMPETQPVIEPAAPQETPVEEPVPA